MGENPWSLKKHAPSLFFQNEEDQSHNVALQLTVARDKYVIRITGGCGNMEETDAEGLMELFGKAFDSYYGGALLFGGTQMRRIEDLESIYPGITEVGPLIRKQCPDARVLGVVPRTGDLKVRDEGLVINEGEDLLTIVHPDQDLCLIVQKSVDQESVWDAEWQICEKIVEALTHAAFQSLLISYNGGGTTEREIRAWVGAGRHVLLLRGSGRKTDEMAIEYGHLDNVIIADINHVDLRKALVHVGALDRQYLPAELLQFPKAT